MEHQQDFAQGDGRFPTTPGGISNVPACTTTNHTNSTTAAIIAATATTSRATTPTRGLLQLPHGGPHGQYVSVPAPPNNIRYHICNVAEHLARNCAITCGRCGQPGYRTVICQAPVPWPQFQRRAQQVAMRRDQRYQALARPQPPSRPAGDLLRQFNNGQQIRGRDEGQEQRVPGGFSNSPRFVDNRMVVPGNFPQTGSRFYQNLNYNDLDEEDPSIMNYNNRVGHININNGVVKSKKQ